MHTAALSFKHSATHNHAQVGATITYLRNETGVIYPACANQFNGRMCQKKMQEISPGLWSCERCAKVRLKFSVGMRLCCR